jgi:hypothetical protein
MAGAAVTQAGRCQRIKTAPFLPVGMAGFTSWRKPPATLLLAHFFY